jgi:hypothetical protein
MERYPRTSRPARGLLRPTPGEADVVSVDREERGALARALGSGTDVLIDVVAYGPEHARQLLAVRPSPLDFSDVAPVALRGDITSINS